MDPNEALRRLRELATAGRTYAEECQQDEGGMTEMEEELADTVVAIVAQVEALDSWLSQGGFPPEAWTEGPDVPAEHIYVAPPEVDVDPPGELCGFCLNPLGGDGVQPPRSRIAYHRECLAVLTRS